MRLPFIGKRRQEFKPSVRISHEPVHEKPKRVEEPKSVEVQETKMEKVLAPKDLPKPLMQKKAEEPQKKVEPVIVKEEPKNEPVATEKASEKAYQETVSAEVKSDVSEQEISVKAENIKKHSQKPYQPKSSPAITLDNKKTDSTKIIKEEQ